MAVLRLCSFGLPYVPLYPLGPAVQAGKEEGQLFFGPGLELGWFCSVRALAVHANLNPWFACIDCADQFS